MFGSSSWPYLSEGDSPARKMVYLCRRGGVFTMSANPQSAACSDPIVRFFRGERVHPNGKTIHEILNLNEPRIGHTGGIIQWLFPLTTPSRHVPSAPTLSPSELELFRTDAKLRELYLVGVNRFLEKFGVAVRGCSGSIESNYLATKSGCIRVTTPSCRLRGSLGR